MSVLVLHLKKKWYDLIKSGEKTVEYRDLTPYWMARITPEKKIVHFYCGYPPKGTPPLIRKIRKVSFDVATDQIEIHLENFLGD